MAPEPFFPVNSEQTTGDPGIEVPSSSQERDEIETRLQESIERYGVNKPRRHVIEARIKDVKG